MSSVRVKLVCKQILAELLGGSINFDKIKKLTTAERLSFDAQDVKAMLLDRGATANAKPELEIYADDVVCAHGATVGELDPMQLYYAAARGLPPAHAKALLLEGFVGGLWDSLGEDSEIATLARTKLRELTQ